MGMRTTSIAWSLVLVSSVGLTAQPGVRLVPPPPARVTFAEPWRPADATGETKVVGMVIDVRQFPVAYARLQLRNLISGTVAQEIQADGNGEYQFIVDEPSTYVVEMLMLDDHVVALSNAGTLARYETLQTVIQLQGRWDASRRSMVVTQNPVNFLGVSAQTTMTAATLNMAVNQNIAPVDPGEPVSPVKP